MNKAIITGNLVKDPELRTTANGIPVCNFTVAVNRRAKDQNGNQEVDYFDVTAWRQTGELCAKYLSKGRKVTVVGANHSSRYQRQDGSYQKTWNIIADEVEFLPSAQGQSQDQGQKQSHGQAHSGQTGAGLSQEEQRNMLQGYVPPIEDPISGYAEIEDDELPF